ncbi:MAG: NAD(P)H-binding protein [Acidobacteriota bacterium]
MSALLPGLFVTGGSGFVGRSVLRHLDPGAFGAVRILGRRDFDLPRSLGDDPSVERVKGTLEDPFSYSSQMPPECSVLHLAARTGRARRKDHLRDTLEATERLLEAAYAVNCRHFVYVSSIAVRYDERAGDHHAEAKARAEEVVRRSGLPCTIVRPTVVLGHGASNWEPLRKMATARVVLLPGDGTKRVQPIWVDDLARTLLGVLLYPPEGCRTVDLGGPEIVSWDELVERIYRASGGNGNGPRVVHLPLAPLIGGLRLAEAVLPALPPVTAGQFASFANDGITPDLCGGSELMGLEEMIRRLLQKDHGVEQALPEVG